MELFERLFNWIGGHIPLLGLAATWAGIFFVWWQRKRNWTLKHFHDQVNFSLNYASDNTLAVRTLLETRANEVWLNEHGVRLMQDAARKTTDDQPFVRLKNPEDMAFVQRALKNTLSERFGESFLAEALSVEVRSSEFLFGITFERYKPMRTLKFRVIIIEKATLLDLFGPEGKGPQLRVTNPVFDLRLRTLQMMHDMYLEGEQSTPSPLGRVYLGVLR